LCRRDFVSVNMTSSFRKTLTRPLKRLFGDTGTKKWSMDFVSMFRQFSNDSDGRIYLTAWRNYWNKWNLFNAINFCLLYKVSWYILLSMCFRVSIDSVILTYIWAIPARTSSSANFWKCSIISTSSSFDLHMPYQNMPELSYIYQDRIWSCSRWEYRLAISQNLRISININTNVWVNGFVRDALFIIFS